VILVEFAGLGHFMIRERWDLIAEAIAFMQKQMSGAFNIVPMLATSALGLGCVKTRRRTKAIE
jgi:hypothetical protein